MGAQGMSEDHGAFSGEGTQLESTAQAESALAGQCLQRGMNAKQDTEVAHAESVGRNVTHFSVTSRWQAGGEPQERVAGLAGRGQRLQGHSLQPLGCHLRLCWAFPGVLHDTEPQARAQPVIMGQPSRWPSLESPGTQAWPWPLSKACL